jgi:nucleotide-binding universal stress UspA family protein
MLVIKHILFPVDFSERSQAAAPFVKTLASRFGAQVTLISVMPPFWEPVSGMLVPGGALSVNMAELKRNLEARLSGALVTELAGVPVRRIAELGDPAQVITQFAQSEGVDLIMMPTHGYGPFRALLLGSVTSKVLHDAQCPVWTAAHTTEPASLRQAECRAVLCAVDGTPKSGPVMEWAAQFSEAMGAKLRIMHAVSGTEGWPERQMDREFQNYLKQSAQEAIERQMQAAGVSAPLCVVVGNVPAAVREEALTHNADVVIIGRGMLDETLGRLRTQAYGIIRSAPCPVISV